MNAFGHTRPAAAQKDTPELTLLSSKRVDAEDVIEYARRCLREGNLIEAESVGEDLLRRFSNLQEARVIIARVHQALGENEKALSVANEVKSITSLNASDQVELHLTRGLAMRGLGQVKESANMFQLAIGVNASDCRPYLHLANLMRLTDDSTQASRIIEEGIERCSQTQELEMFAHILADWPESGRLQ